MLPLGLLNAAQGHPMLVELKNGETLNGHLVLCDTWMNLTLREVVQTSPEGDRFMRLPEVYVKGNNIKYLRVPDEIIDILCELSDVPASRLDSTPTPVIYQALHLLPSRQGQGGRIRHLVRYLVEQRGEPPSVSLYEALVVANFDTATGSASELRDMLLEMKKAGVQPSRSFYHRALQLLAIHPDYLSRNTILRDLKDRGMELNDSGKCSVALGLLRDGQNEMALDYWDELCRDKTDIPDWVFEIFVYVLTARGFVDEALQVFRQRLDKAPVPLRTWFYLLEECSRSLHYEGTTFIWEKMVQPGTLHPADGICLNVLNTASRHGDPALATAVIQLLSDRGVKLGLHHYEPLLESYVHVGDLENAFRVLCIMAGAGVQPDQSSTRSIYAMLKGSPERVKGAVSILEKLHKEHELPAVALNVLLEVLAETGDMARTLDTYRQVCDLCRSGPNQQTFDILLGQDCRSADAVFLISEMDRFSIRPSAPILDSLIYSFALDGNLDVAMLYLTEMNRLAGSSSWLSRRTFLTVLLRCYKENDPRLPMLLEEAKRRWADIEEEFASRVTEIRRRE
ncbi:731093d0-256e-4ca0-9ce6-15993e1e8095 [Thermothielavioides terrestris]|uniref:731093d0-256e-4ca0-9ce6-15993e1e8095 n=1 Tax=Thermothielavioides terrestris TaxID=2587410 RepID=A0A3S5CXA3_9PEZI|nr:731093d0-256e-4ca0-9ce6-15993e1e8095 [Thermothielavioides terrestris]